MTAVPTRGPHPEKIRVDEPIQAAPNEDKHASTFQSSTFDGSVQHVMRVEV